MLLNSDIHLAKIYILLGPQHSPIFPLISAVLLSDFELEQDFSVCSLWRYQMASLVFFSR